MVYSPHLHRLHRSCDGSVSTIVVTRIRPKLSSQPERVDTLFRPERQLTDVMLSAVMFVAERHRPFVARFHAYPTIRAGSDVRGL
jgi:hypothetical protein